MELLSQTDSHHTPLRFRVGTLMGLPGKIGPTAEKHFLEAVWKELELGGC